MSTKRKREDTSTAKITKIKLGNVTGILDQINKVLWTLLRDPEIVISSVGWIQKDQRERVGYVEHFMRDVPDSTLHLSLIMLRKSWNLCVVDTEANATLFWIYQET